MMITDPIADMLTRIRNGLIAKHDTVEMPASKLKKAVLDIIVKEGFIKSAEVINEGVQGKIVVALKYAENGERVITGLKRVSKPGLRIYATSDKLPKVLGGLGIAIISTSKGVMTCKQAKTLNLGGELLAYVW